MRVTREAQMVSDGRRIKWTLEECEQKTGARVRVDWLRFTLPIDAVIRAEWGAFNADALEAANRETRELMLRCRVTGASAEDTAAGAVAMAGARMLCGLLAGSGCEVGVCDGRGMDFYTARCAIERQGLVVGWVLAGGKSSRQASTVHVNLFGSALLYVSPAHLAAIRSVIDAEHGWITRADLAVDLWRGYSVQDVRTSYLAGEFDVRGKRPGQQEHGSWTLGHSRTFEVGSRDSGKMLRGYEKGDQLFGPEANDPWVRLEVEFRNNQRIISSEVLTRPADFFAGAYPFCARILAGLEVEAEAERLESTRRLVDATEEAAMQGNLRYLFRTAKASIRVAFEHGGDVLADVVNAAKGCTPGRLKGIDPARFSALIEKVSAGLVPRVEPFATGTV